MTTKRQKKYVSKRSKTKRNDHKRLGGGLSISTKNVIHSLFVQIRSFQQEHDVNHVYHIVPLIHGDNGMALLETSIRAQVSKFSYTTFTSHLTFHSGRSCHLIMSVTDGTIDDLQHVVYKIHLWMSILDMFASPESSRELTVYLIMSPLLKTLPSRNDQEIDTIHANTAYTFCCKAKNDMVIFRKEEWFKVFIHETMHAFCLDFACDNQDAVHKRVISLFRGIDPNIQDIRLYESYTEMWAETVHLVLCTSLKYPQLSFRNIFPKILKGIHDEQSWSAKQCDKVLAHYGFTYQQLVEGTQEFKYKETMTSVFSYYVVKCVWMLHINDFIAWCVRTSNDSTFRCLQFTKTSETMIQFCDLLEDLYKDKVMSRLEIHDNGTNRDQRSLRMSCT